MLWCSSLKYEECCLLLHTFLTDTNAVKKILLIKTLWKYNKILLFFTMKPRILSWHPDVMLKWRVDGSHGRCWSCPAWPSESCWCPLHQTPGATQLPGPPPFSPPIWHFSVFLSAHRWLGLLSRSLHLHNNHPTLYRLLHMLWYAQMVPVTNDELRQGRFKQKMLPLSFQNE